MKTTKPTSVSIVIATFNSSRTLTLCLKKVLGQDYPKKYIEIITADGGSKDNTIKIAKKYGAKVIHVDPKKQNAEYNKGIGLQAAKNDIVLFLDHDNIMPHRKWLSNLIAPFIEEKAIIGVEALRFHYDPKMTLLDRYFALFGGTDPVVYYLGKNSHLSWSEDRYTLLGKSEDKGSYYEVSYLKSEIPALGGNGAAIRRRLLLKYAKSDPESFIHVDVVADLIRSGNNKYGIIKDTIIHLTNNNVLPFLSRRKYFIQEYQLGNKKRRYHTFDAKKDKGKMIAYILFSLTFVVPTWDALKGFIKVRDMAWFLHPFMCLAFLYLYGTAVIEEKIKHV